MSNMAERRKARESMGFCLQQNAIYDSLTVDDHLRFIAKLRGIPANEIDTEVCLFDRVPNYEYVLNACENVSRLTSCSPS